MMIISFSWTSDAFKANRKTKTRRQWVDGYAKRFEVGDICKAYNKQPRFGGKQIGLIKLTKSPYQQQIRDMPDSDFEAEGFAYMEENNIEIWGKDARQSFEDWRCDGGYYWVVEFEKIK